ncbi:MAG: L,D-transpeptidase family protein [Hyphomicrobiaceae bacterium]
MSRTARAGNRSTTVSIVSWVAATAALALPLAPASAQRGKPAMPASVERDGNGPLIAVVSIGEQRLTVYDRDGVVARSPISSGAQGHRTPTGIFSVIQKKVQHTSNLYFAEMPHMQRITWSGIAMHAGVLPGYPASHGCIRLPSGFARDLFRITDLGMRVIVAPDAPKPVAFAHEALFSPRPVDLEPLIARIGPKNMADAPIRVARTDTGTNPRPEPRTQTHSQLPGVMRLGLPATEEPAPSAAPAPITKTPEREATGTLPALRRGARTALATAAKAAQTERATLEQLRARHARALSEFTTLERTVARATARLEGARQAFARARTVRAIDEAIAAEKRAAEQLAEAAAGLDDLGDAAKAARAEIAAASETFKTAEAGRAEAQALVGELDRMNKPVHVLVSRKTMKIYVRQGMEPVLEAPVTIADAGQAFGTHVFTVMSTTDTAASWSVVSVDQKQEVLEQRRAQRAGMAPVERISGPAVSPAAALARITIPDAVRQRVSEMLTPGSSLIVSDEGPSGETGKGTDIIVLTR